ncbi:ABC transporter permease [Halostagnicola kamekurae]|uniref:ABC-2 type transport system permease protein n=1 Tax=Halostagnicola kamekurae TaxID=619731 RepID=A0A1I6PHZ2_9EURY|nr:ABC transporter permease [Halostagnicola kamekurae]SFS39832.1 ABC-2 type transport system permease protein [Halostagnicola kamekurae]
MSIANTQLRTLIQREVLRFVRRPYNTFLPPLITNVLYFSVFGVILGSRIGSVGDVTYIQFVLPGLVVLGAMSNAFENASFSIFHGRWNEYIHEVITSPLSHTQTVGGYVISSALRGIIIGGLIVAVGFLFTTVPFAHPLYLLSFGVVTTTLFAGLGIIGGLWAEDFDHLTVMNQFLLRPLVFFGGVFYSLDQLEGLAYTASLLNPMVYMVNGVRYGMIGVTEIDPNRSLLVLSGAAVVVLAIDLYLFKRGYGISD